MEQLREVTLPNEITFRYRWPVPDELRQAYTALVCIKDAAVAQRAARELLVNSICALVVSWSLCYVRPADPAETRRPAPLKRSLVWDMVELGYARYLLEMMEAIAQGEGTPVESEVSSG